MLRVMTFNIRFDNPSDGRDAWPNRRGAVAAVIHENEASIVGVQEALRHQVAELQERLPGYGWSGVGRADGREEGEFSPIFYRKERFELLDEGAFWLSQSPDQPGSKGWDADLPRVATWAKLKDKEAGSTLLAANTHFDHQGEQARAESAKLLLRKLPALAQGAPIVLTGDFNMLPEAPPYRIFTGERSSTGAFHLHDARAVSEVDPQGPNSTWNGFNTIVPNFRIDYIFVSREWRVLGHHTLTAQFEGHFVSDHLPILADLDLADE